MVFSLHAGQVLRACGRCAFGDWTGILAYARGKHARAIDLKGCGGRIGGIIGVFAGRGVCVEIQQFGPAHLELNSR